jgi:hypothetical protein
MEKKETYLELETQMPASRAPRSSFIARRRRFGDWDTSRRVLTRQRGGGRSPSS